MNDLLSNVKSFFEMLEWKFLIAGAVMIIIFTLMVYLISLIVLSVQRRRNAIKTSLPDIKDVGGEGAKSAAFKELEDLEIELIDNEEDVIALTDDNNNEELFLTALAIETGQYVSLASEPSEMPEVGELDIEAIKEQKRLESEERRKMALARMKIAAKADKDSNQIEELENELMRSMQSKQKEGNL